MNPIEMAVFINHSEKNERMEESNNPSLNSEYDQNFMFHPWNVMLVLTLIGISGLFLAIMIAFVYTRVTNDVDAIQIPWLFAFNTIILIGGSYTMRQAKKAYLDDNTQGYQHSLRNTLLLTLLFLLMQILAWWQLFSQDIFLDPSNNGANYLYLLSILHFAHVIIGLPFLFLFHRAARLQMKEPITVLVYFSDPEKRLKLRLLTMYWNFLDLLWILLVVFLFVNYLIR